MVSSATVSGTGVVEGAREGMLMFTAACVDTVPKGISGRKLVGLGRSDNKDAILLSSFLSSVV
jgi:hypothetical protein